MLRLSIIYVLAVSTVLAAQNVDLNQARFEDEFRWGVSAFHLGFFNEAILRFERSLSIKSESNDSRKWLGRSYYRSGFNNIAFDQWNYILNKGGNHLLLANMIGHLKRRSSLAEHIRFLPQYVRTNSIDTAFTSGYNLLRPTGITADIDGAVYVTAFGSDEIIVVDINGIVVNIFRGGFRGLDGPFDVIKVDGELFITEFSADRISKYSEKGQLIKVFGSGGPLNQQLQGPQYLAFDGKEFIYVSDWGNHRVVKFDTNGQFILTFEGIEGPTGIVVDGTKVYIADRANRSIIEFDQSGNKLRTFVSDQLLSPEGLEIAEKGKILIADTFQVLQLDTLSEEVTLVESSVGIDGNIVDLTKTQNGELWAVNFDSNNIEIFNTLLGQETGLFVQILRIDSQKFPDITLELLVENAEGFPIVGLSKENFVVTENGFPVKDLSILSNPVNKNLMSDLVIMVENSPKSNLLYGTIQRILDQIVEEYTGYGSINVVSVSNDPVIESFSKEKSLISKEILTKSAENKDWRFDRGLRLAVSSLLGSKGKKSIIFIGTGNLNDSSFKEYSLGQSLDFLKNNQVDFFPVSIDEIASPELDFLAKESGGKFYDYRSSAGIKNLVSGILTKKSQSYALSFSSFSNSGFGREYIPLTVEVETINQTGGDKLGYFAPLTF